MSRINWPDYRWGFRLGIDSPEVELIIHLGHVHYIFNRWAYWPRRLELKWLR